MISTFENFKITIPATTANLGSSFDCLGLSLSLYNTTSFSPCDNGIELVVNGEGKGILPENEQNLIFQSMMLTADFLGKSLPKNIKIKCENHIPISSGMGSSASAALAGILAANKLLGSTLSDQQIYRVGFEIEGHSDNLIAAYLGGLQLIVPELPNFEAYQLPIDEWNIVLFTPTIELSTKDSRQALPSKIDMTVAVDAIAKSNLSIEALRTGNTEQLIVSLADNLHQPYRLPLVPGAEDVFAIFKNAGIPIALSGAGPSMIAFLKTSKINISEIENEIKTIYINKKIPLSIYHLAIDRKGATII